MPLPALGTGTVPPVVDLDRPDLSQGMSEDTLQYAVLDIVQEAHLGQPKAWYDSDLEAKFRCGIVQGVYPG